MKKHSNVLKKALSLACCLAMALSMIPAAGAAENGPAKSSNQNRQTYSRWSSTVKSYLYENEDGGLTRVEYIGGEVVIEDYSSSFQYLSSRTVSPELPIWGGFFAGEDYNFLIFGQNNSEQSDSKEVIRVVKYDKDWNRLGQASLNGANTTVPFDAGSLRCDEYNGYLFIRTCHEMYNGHQANLTMAVRQRDMTVTDSYYDVMNTSYGYVSHSFNQFILVDEDGKVVALDHGDAYPRGVAFTKYYADASTGKFTGGRYSQWCSYGTMMEFAGNIGANDTGATVGGLAETTDCYIMTYNYDGQGGGGDRYPYYHWMDKASGKSWSALLTQTPSSTPVLAPTGLDGGYMLWNGTGSQSGALYYIHYGANGQPGEIQTATGSLSDCQPIFYNGKAVWYTTSNSTPVFYRLDASGVSATSADETSQPEVPSDPCANGHTWRDETVPATCQTEGQTLRTCAVCGEKEVLSTIPTTDHTWVEKTDPATGRNYQVCSVCGAEETLSVIPAAFTDVHAGDWFKSDVDKVAAAGIMNGMDDGVFAPYGNLTIAQALKLAYELDSRASGAALPQTGGAWYTPYYQYCLDRGIITAGQITASDFDRPATRFDMLEIFDKAVPASRLTAVRTVNSVPDLAESAPHGSVVYKWYRADIISGDDAGRFNGSNNITRAEVAAILCRINNL